MQVLNNGDRGLGLNGLRVLHANTICVINLDQCPTRQTAIARLDYYSESAGARAVETGNASSRLSCSGRFGARRIAVRRGCNAGARLFCDSHQPTLRSARAQHHHATGTLTNTPAPALDMTSQAVLAAQPKSAPEAGLTKVDPAAREARA